MMQTVLFVSLLVSGVSSQLLVHKNDIEVPIGREVYLKPDDLQFASVSPEDVCKVEVVPNEPLFLRVGLLDPQVFDCDFKYGTVKYVHHGSPLLTRDSVKLRVYKFSKKDTFSEFFDLNFVIKNESYNIVQLVQPVMVEDLLGLSNVINASHINFNYSRNEGAVCKARMSRYLSGRPAYGQVVVGRDKRPVDVIKRKCDDFLLLNLRYKHMKSPSPNIDFITIVAEVSDPLLNNGELVTEWFHIPVEVLPAFPNLPPKASFSGMYLMDVDQFIVTTITPAVLSSTDSETPSEQLIFNISRPLQPRQGCIVHLADHTRCITSFHQSDLNNFNIAYKPPTKSFKERQMFEVGFTIHDGDFAVSEPFTLYIAIRPAMTKAPRIFMNAGMVLLEGQSRPIRLSNLEIADGDNANSVQIFVTGGLHHGKLEVANRPAVSFTRRDIEAGRVVYHHDDSDSVKDSIHLRVYDGSHSIHLKFPITIIPKDDSPPTLVVNVGLHVDEGESVPITMDTLRAVDHDTSDEHITFIIKKLPTAGAVIKKFAWEKSGNAVSQFTQRDINKNLMYYQHDGSETIIDSMTVVIQDVNNPPNISPPYKVLIQIAPVGDDPPRPDLASLFSLEVHEVDLGMFSSKHLRYLDAESRDSEIVYTITEQPKYTGSFSLSDPGKLVSLLNETYLEKNPHTPAISVFTQEEVNHFKVAYMPPMDDIGPNPLHLQFGFSVTNKYNSSVTGQIFNITVLPVNNQMPQLHTGQLYVEEGSSTLLSTSELSVYDPDTLRTDLQMSLFTVPLHGALHRSGQPLRVGDLLSLDDILTLRLEYKHDGSESLRDSFKVGVNDGLHFVAGDVLIEIEPVDDETPVWLSGLQSYVSVNETGSVRLTSQVLSAYDADTDNGSLFFILTKPPRFGSIVVDSRKVTKFMQKDVADGKVLYIHNGIEIGPAIKEDLMTFIVTDKAFPRLASHPTHRVGVKILPYNNQPPKVLFRKAVVVDEGKKIAITEDNLSAHDPDTLPSELLLHVTKPPVYGYLDSIRPRPGYEAPSRQRAVNVFSLKDIKNGFVIYAQSNHRGIEPESDTFEVYATDGLYNSSMSIILVSITLQNDEEPVFVLPNITVNEGGNYTLGNDGFSASDGDFPGDILVISVKTKPAHGSLMHAVQAVHKGQMLELPFKVSEVINFKDVIYKHDDTEDFEDAFELILSDGVHNISKTCYVTVLPVNDEPPRVLKNVAIQGMETLSNLLLSSAFLLAEDIDSKPSELLFNIITEPNCGILEVKNNTNRFVDNEWLVMETTQFTQADISSNLVRYVHNVSSCYEDSFIFTVTDGVHVTKESKFAMKFSREADIPIFIVSNLTVEKGESVVFDSTVFQVTDTDFDAEDILFVVLNPPKWGKLGLISTGFEPLQNFSLSSAQSGQIGYKHSGLSDNEDFINLLVTNHISEKDLTVVVEVVSNNVSAPIVPRLEVLMPLIVDKSDFNSTIITSKHLFSSNNMSKSSEIYYLIVQQPQYGMLMYNRSEAIEMFLQDDINKNLISYKINETNQMEEEDKFYFVIGTGREDLHLLKQMTLRNATVFHIEVKANQQPKSPFVRILSPHYVHTVWNGHLGFRLSSENLQVFYPGSPKAEVKFHVVRYLQHGYIFSLLKEKVIRIFTQDDIDNNKIVVILKQGAETTDFFTFHISVDEVTYDKEHKMEFYWATVYFPLPEYSVCEDFGVLDISIHRAGNASGSSFVSVSAVGQTAIEGLDYIPGQVRKVQFDPGKTSASWKMAIIQDRLEEAPIEQVQVILFSPENAVIGTHNQTLVSIYDKNRGSCAHLPSNTATPSNRHGKEKPKESKIRGKYSNESSLPPSNMECDQHIHGLLQYNRSAGMLFVCNGQEWKPWSLVPSKKTNGRSEVNGISSTSDGKTKGKPDEHLTGPTHPSHVTSVYSEAKYSGSCPEGWHLFNNECQKFHRHQSTWGAAQSLCQNYRNGNLVVVKSREHNTELVRLARNKPFWIGLHASLHTNKWRYTGSNYVPYTNWKKGFPRLPASGEIKHRCVLVRGSGLWINRHCEYHEHSFICSFPITNQT